MSFTQTPTDTHTPRRKSAAATKDTRPETETDSLNFRPNPAVAGRESQFITVTVALKPVLESWQTSLFAHEWLHTDGTIKAAADLSEKERDRRDHVEKLLMANQPIEMPVLGIGILDNIEIGSGRATLLTLADRGLRTIPVHIPKSHSKAFASCITARHDE